MIALLSRARSRIADILDARTLARTVRLLSRQLDHAHLAGQIEEARADAAEERAEAERQRAGELRGLLFEADNHAADQAERLAELEHQIQDWRLQSGELVAEQAAADLPDLAPADDGGPPSPLPADPYARAEIQAKRADALEQQLAACARHRIAAETHAADLEIELATVRERAARLSARLSVVALEREEQIQRADGLAQTLQSCGAELATTRAQLQQTERSAGAHLATIERLGQEQNARDNHSAATIERLQAQIEEARRAGHVPAVELQIPAVLAAHEACEDFAHRLAADAPSKIAGPWHVDEYGDLVRDIIGQEPDFAAHVDRNDRGSFDGAAWNGCKPTLEVTGCAADVLQTAIDAALRAAGWTLRDDDTPPETQPSERIAATREEPRL